MLPTWAIQFIFVGALIGGAYWYWTWSQDEIGTLRDEVTALELANEINESTIQAQVRAIKFNAAAYTKLAKQAQTTEQYKDSLIEIFQEHDLEKLSIAKPGLIENRINAGTKKVFSDLESLTDPDRM